MGKIQQASRSTALATPLGEDVLLLRKFVGQEQLGRPFAYNLDLCSDDHSIAFDDIVGQNVTVRIERHDGETRYFNGYISEFIQKPEAGNMARYGATMVPWLWFLSRRSDCRIFQEMTVPDIIKQVFRDQGFSDFDDALNGTYRTWEYCVQYRETDFQFVSRLMEQEGIYYFFEHDNGKHTLVLADSVSAHEAVAGYEQIPYYPPNKQIREHECIWKWSIRQKVQSGAFAVNDFDFKNPKNALEARSQVTRGHAVASFDQYDYPCEYTEVSEGENYAKIRLQELQTNHEVLSGVGDPRGLSTGSLFNLTQPIRDDQEREYLVTSAKYRIRSDAFGSEAGVMDDDDDDSGDDGETPLYVVEFTALDSAETFRTARTTAKPIVQGPQTAMVVGKSGEEIWTDEHGRVKVKFHWDRYSMGDETSSCWIRVSQNWAGKKWGSLFLPRIGQEVIIEFLEGDPDRPIITGRVYNAETTPPYKLPDHATMSTVKSNSSKGGGGFNEIRFQDKKDEEQIFIHAQKNMDIRVVASRFENIGVDGEGCRHLLVEKDKFEHIKNNRHEKVDNDHSEEIGNDRNLKVTGKQAVAIDKSLSVTVGEDVAEVFKKNHSEETTDDYYLKATNLVIEGTEHITIKVGDSYMVIESAGIKLGTTGDIELEAGGSILGSATSDVKLEASANAEIKASSAAKLEASGNVTIKGSATNIN